MDRALIEYFERERITFDALPLKEGRRLWARWCEMFLGAPRRGRGLPWDALEDDSMVAVKGKRALAAYGRIEEREYYVFWGGLPPALRCSSPALPDLGAANLDACVTALDFSWTMAFSHEDGRYGGVGWGPYFSRAVWQAKPGTD